MADTLVVRLPRERDAPLQWVGVDRHGQLTSAPGAGEAAHLPAAAAGRRVVLVVPAEDVSQLSANVPAAGEARLAQLLPFALEEQVAEDIDRLHFAAGSRLPDGNTATDVVARARMDEWLALQSEWNVTFDAIYAESELVPELEGHLSLLIEKELLILAAPGRRPALLPAEDIWLSIELGVGGETDLSQFHVIVYATAVDWQRHSAEVEALRSRFASLKVQLLTSGVLPLLAPQVYSAKAVNLRQGAYVPPRPLATSWKAWRLAAVLAGVLVLLHVVSAGLSLRAAKKTEADLDAQLSALVAGLAPGQAYSSDLRQRLERQLSSAASGAAGDRASLLALLTSVAQARQSEPSARIRALSFKQGNVEMTVQGPDAGSLDRINQALRGAGLKSDLTSGTPGKDGYQGRMRVEAAGRT